MRLGDEGRAPIEVIPTGSIALDVALGIGGLPRGRVVEIYGPESSGKTSLALHAVANAQKAGGIAAFIDAEHALDPDYAQKLGVDTQALRKLAGALNQTKTTAIFINQLREKIGVMFGCMTFGTKVTLADGTQEKIGKIVNQRLDVEVLSYDLESGEIVPRRIVSWFNNGRAERFLQFTVAKSGGNGRAQFAATENHLIQGPGGWRPAGEL